MTVAMVLVLRSVLDIRSRETRQPLSCPSAGLLLGIVPDTMPRAPVGLGRPPPKRRDGGRRGGRADGARSAAQHGGHAKGAAKRAATGDGGTGGADSARQGGAHAAGRGGTTGDDGTDGTGNGGEGGGGGGHLPSKTVAKHEAVEGLWIKARIPLH
jgi:hypothetical protein